MGDCDAIKYKGNQMTAGCCWRAGFLMTLYLRMCFFFLSLFSIATSAQVDGSGGHHPQRGPEEWRKREWLACFWEGLHGAQLLLAVNRDARQAWRLQSSRCAVCVIAPIGWTISVTFLYCFPFAHCKGTVLSPSTPEVRSVAPLHESLLSSASCVVWYIVVLQLHSSCFPCFLHSVVGNHFPVSN